MFVSFYIMMGRIWNGGWAKTDPSIVMLGRIWDRVEFGRLPNSNHDAFLICFRSLDNGNMGSGFCMLEFSPLDVLASEASFSVITPVQTLWVGLFVRSFRRSA
jgi:hypothetical protein